LSSGTMTPLDRRCRHRVYVMLAKPQDGFISSL
jgi:hypothetical protein